MLAIAFSTETKTDSKALPYQCQEKSKALADSEAIFLRILQTLGAKNAPEAARTLGLSKQSVYDWQKTTPSLDNLIRIAESGNASIHWILTGQGTRYVDGPARTVTFDEVLSKRVREIIREDLQTKELTGNDVSQIAQWDGLRAMIRDIVREEVASSRKRPVYPLNATPADEIEETTRRKKAG